MGFIWWLTPLDKTELNTIVSKKKQNSNYLEWSIYRFRFVSMFLPLISQIQYAKLKSAVIW